MPPLNPEERAAAVERFQPLYQAQFGVESKPEYDALVQRLGLSPEQALQLMHDLTLVIRHVFDAYFAEHNPVLPSSARRSHTAENA